MIDTTATEVMEVDLPEFEQLISLYQGMVFGIAHHFLRDPSVAEEVSQDVFLKLYHSLPSIKSETHAIAWLRKVTSHRCIDYSRRRRKDLALDEIPEPAAKSPPGDPMLAQRLQKIVASLPPKARIVVILRYQEDLRPEEIAQTLGWRLNTVKSRLHRSLALMRDKLAVPDEDGLKNTSGDLSHGTF